MAERLVAPQLPDFPEFDDIRFFDPELAAGMFGHQYFVLT